MYSLAFLFLSGTGGLPSIFSFIEWSLGCSVWYVWYLLKSVFVLVRSYKVCIFHGNNSVITLVIWYFCWASHLLFSTMYLINLATFWDLMMASLSFPDISLNLLLRVPVKSYKIQIQHFGPTSDILSTSSMKLLLSSENGQLFIKMPEIFKQLMQNFCLTT